MKDNEERTLSARELVGDYINEFTLLEPYLWSVAHGSLSQGECIAVFKNLFDKQGGKVARTFLERSKENYGTEQIPEEYKKEIEKLDTLVERINSLFVDFFTKKSIGADDFLSTLAPLATESIEIINNSLK